jgi:hypothetical protein
MPSIQQSFFSFDRILMRRNAPVTNLSADCLEFEPTSIASAHFMATHPV